MPKDEPNTESIELSQGIKAEIYNNFSILESVNGMILACNCKGSLIFANKKAREALGINPEAISGLNICDFVNSAAYELLEEKLFMVLEEKTSLSFEAYVADARKTPSLCRLNLSVMLDKEKSEELVLILLEDLSEKRQMEEHFIDSEHRLAHIIDFLPDAILAIDCNGRVIAWNRAAEEMTGVKATAIMGKGNYEYALPFYGYRRPILLNQVLSADKDWAQTYIVFEKKGLALRGENFCPALGENGAYLQAAAAPLFNITGELIGAIETIKDLTRKKQAEEAISIQRELTLSLAKVDEIKEALSICLDTALKISGMDDGIILLLGEKGGKFSLSAHRGLYPKLIEQIKIAAFRHDISLCSQPLYLSADEVDKHFSNADLVKELKTMAIIPIYHKNELLASLITASTKSRMIPGHSRRTLEDVSDYMGTIIARLLAEAELRESEERFRQLVEVSPDAIAVHINGRLVFSNQAGVHFLGAKKAEDILGRRIIDFVHPDSRQLYIDLMEPLKTQGVFPLSEMKVLLENGNTIYTEVAGAALQYRGQPAVQYVMRDISARKKAERELAREVRKLRVLYELAVSMSSSQSLDEILRLTTEKIKELFAADCIVIFLMDEREGVAYPYALSGNIAEDWLDIRIPYGEGLIGMVAASGKGYIVDNYLEDTGITHSYDELILEEGLLCALAAPIIIGEECLGVIMAAHRKTLGLSHANLDTLTLIANLLAIEITRERAEESLQESLRYLEKMLESTVSALSTTAEQKDAYTAGHQRRVALLACAIARELKLPQACIDNIRTASILHDIGKLQIPTDILSKPGELSEIERMLVKTHSQAGYEIIKTIPFDEMIATALLQHHERMDGSGYPLGLSGEEIILEARILAVADVVEAMASHRPYRPALGIEAALAEIRRGTGVLYDAGVAKACLKLFADKNFSFE